MSDPTSFENTHEIVHKLRGAECRALPELHSIGTSSACSPELEALTVIHPKRQDIYNYGNGRAQELGHYPERCLITGSLPATLIRNLDNVFVMAVTGSGPDFPVIEGKVEI